MNRVLTALENAIMVVALLGALAIGTLQVVLRYVFNTNFVWTELTLITLTILAVLVGGSRAAADNIHVRITVLSDNVPAAARRVLDVLSVLVALAYSAFMAYVGILYVQFLKMTGLVSVEADFPSWIIYAIGPFAMILFVLRYLGRLPRALRGEETSRLEFTE